MKKENCQNEKIVQSKLSMKVMLLGLLDVCCCFLLGRFFYYGLENNPVGKVYGNWWLEFFFPLLFVAVIGLLCLIMLFYALLCFKYCIVIDTSQRRMIAFSLLRPKGVILELNDYTGYYVQIKTTRSMIDGHIIRASQEVGYLVDLHKRTRQIMSSMAYRNYRQLKEALGLLEVTEQGIPLPFRRKICRDKREYKGKL